MKAAILAAAALAAVTTAFPASAIERYNVNQMSCASVQQAVARDGAAILRYPSKRVANYTLYDRYVASSRFCRFEERAVRAYVPTRDARACPVYKCEVVERLFDCDDPFLPFGVRCRR